MTRERHPEFYQALRENAKYYQEKNKRENLIIKLEKEGKTLEMITTKQMELIQLLKEQIKLSDYEYRLELRKHGAESLKELDSITASRLIEALQQLSKNMNKHLT